MYQRSWTLGLESQEDTPEDDALEPVITEEPSDTVEATDLDVNQASDDLDAADQEANDLTKDIDQLQTVHDVVADSVGDGGCEVSNARLIDVAIENFTTRWDLPKATLGCESMAYASPSVRATIGCESIGEAVKAGIKKLIEFIKAVITRIKSLFGAAGALPEKLLKRAEGLKKALAERDGKEFNRKKWKTGAWAENISIAGKYDPKRIYMLPGRIIMTTDYLFEDAGTIAESISEKERAVKPTPMAKIKAKFWGQETLTPQISKTIGIFSNEVKTVAFPGEVYLVGDRWAIPAFDNIRPPTKDDYAMHVVTARALHDRGEVSAPGHEEIGKAIQASIEFATALQEHLSNKDKIQGRLDLMNEGISALENAMENAAEHEDKHAFSSLIVVRRQEMSNLKAMSQAAILGIRNAAVGMLSYAEAGLRCYA